MRKKDGDCEKCGHNLLYFKLARTFRVKIALDFTGACVLVRSPNCMHFQAWFFDIHNELNRQASGGWFFKLRKHKAGKTKTRFFISPNALYVSLPQLLYV